MGIELLIQPLLYFVLQMLKLSYNFDTPITLSYAKYHTSFYRYPSKMNYEPTGWRSLPNTSNAILYANIK